VSGSQYDPGGNQRSATRSNLDYNRKRKAYELCEKQGELKNRKRSYHYMMRGRKFTKIGEFAKTCVFSTDYPWLDLSICGGYETTEEETEEGFNNIRHLGFAL
jgi:hypothetical protein